MPEPAASPSGAGRIRKTVGTPRAERPLQTLARLWRRHRAQGAPIVLPDAHVRKSVGRARPR